MGHLSHKQELRKIAELYGAKLRFNSRLDVLGRCDYKNSIIYLKVTDDEKQNLSTLFHEIGHIYCYEHCIYPSYHHSKPRIFLGKAEVQSARYTAFRAECYVERWAKLELKKYYPEVRYQGYYGNNKSRLWLINSYLNIWYNTK